MRVILLYGILVHFVTELLLTPNNVGDVFHMDHVEHIIVVALLSIVDVALSDILSGKPVFFDGFF